MLSVLAASRLERLHRIEPLVQISADGKWLWLSGRYDGVIYAFNTDDGSVKTIPVGGMPRGLTVWPQPGRYSLGHTGNLR